MSRPNMEYCMFENTNDAMDQLIENLESEGLASLVREASDRELSAIRDTADKCLELLEALGISVEQDTYEDHIDDAVKALNERITKAREEGGDDDE